MSGCVERVSNSLPQVQRTWVWTYSGWMSVFIATACIEGFARGSDTVAIVSAGRRRRIAWGLIVVGITLSAEVLLADRYDVGSSTAFGWKTALALGVAVAVLAAGAIEACRAWAGWPQEAAVRRAARLCAPGLVALTVYFCAFLVMSPVATGDQPHYELEALSLAYDHDRDLANDHARLDRVRVISPRPFGARHIRQYKPGGPYISFHHVGLPLLLAPAVPVMRAVQQANPRLTLWTWHVEIIVLAALAAQLLYLVLKRLSTGGSGLRVAVWASVVFSPPMVVYAHQIYPEMPAVLLALLAVYALLRTPTRTWIVVGAIAAALLPWLHVRFLPVAGALALALGYRAVTALRGANVSRAAEARAAAAALTPFVMSCAAMALAFQHWYGSPLPDAQYAGPTSPGLADSYGSLAGGLWSSNRGWLPFAPAAMLAFVGIALLRPRFGRPALIGLAIASGYLALVTYEAIDPGYAFPGRYVVLLMPFAAIPLLVLVEELRWPRPLFLVLAAMTIALTAATIIQPMPAITGTPGIASPVIPYTLWDWFVGIWPAVSLQPRAPDYPDAAAVATWTAAMLGLAAVAYGSERRQRSSAPAHASDSLR